MFACIAGKSDAIGVRCAAKPSVPAPARSFIAAAPTRRALEYVHPRLVAGAIMVFDDYGEAGLEDQRAVVDEFLSEQPESVIALPTRQGLLVKR